MESTDSRSAAAEGGAPLVSIVVANYNMAPYVADAIRSLLTQTVADVEVIVVDDGSTDSSWEIIQQEAARDPRVVPIRQQNAGQASAKNAGIRAARGKFVGFCDADDVWLPHKLAVQLPEFDDPRVGVVYTDLYAMDAEGNKTGESNIQPRNGDVLADLFIRNFVPFGTALVRRDALAECGAFDESYRMGIDWDLWMRIARRFHFKHVREWTAMYRVWPGQMSKDWRGRYFWAFRIMRDFTSRFPSAVDARTRRRAFGNTYLNRGFYRGTAGGERLGGSLDVIKGLWFCPTDTSAFRILGKIWLPRSWQEAWRRSAAE
jgi:glycosyltransferase involved in cell wall biosynthesis